MVPTPAASRKTATEFITRATIQYGPRELLARYFLLADQRLKARGVTLTFASFDELLAANTANRANWLPLTPTFNPTFNRFDPETSFCFIVRNAAGEPVGAHAGRRFDLSGSSFANLASSLRLFYDDPVASALSGETCTVSSPTAETMTGIISYTGAVWYRPDHRGLGLPFYVSRLARSYAYAQWGLSYAIGMVSDGNVTKGLTDKTGNSHIERGVHARGSTHGDVDYQIVWSTPAEIFAQLQGVLGGDEPGLIADQRRA